ncbi:hypothetical protein [Streptomyces sp. NPDC048436]|uniref:hypothetical protein n=1 Tax=Streptomyces sp. NPDC048436 TaxID=3365550 RepID=UPI0037235FA8
MKFRLLGPAVAAAALIGTTLSTGVASADVSASAAPNCRAAIINVPAKESVKIRTHAKLGATAVGVWSKGKKGTVCNDGKPITGQKYTLCGKTSTQWLYGGPNNSSKIGYVPRACIKW